MPKITEEQKQERIERILEGARRCFAQHGYEGATVTRLEAEIGISRGAIFNWFPSKEELFIELARRDNTRLLTLIVEEGLEGIFAAMLAEDADWLAVYLEFGRRLRASPELRERWKEIAGPEVQRRVEQWIVAQQEGGALRNDLSPSQLGRFLGVVIDGVVVQRALGFDPPDAELTLRLVADALGPLRDGQPSSSP